ncbi:MAG: 4'-phosphopantetheinyl transferase superfamily protein [Pseudomonadota bacterium]
MLETDTVHVWRAHIGDINVSRWREFLSADEQARAARFHFQKDRAQFIAARGLLRTLLGCYLNTPPAALRFGYNEYGKPALLEQCNPSDVRFNYAHSHGVVLCALARGREVGVDLERVQTQPEHEHIAAQFFSAREIAALRALPPAQRQRAFFTCWVRKEAYIKALGKGLSFPLHQFSVTLAPGEAPRVIGAQDDPAEEQRWTLHDLPDLPGYAAALAVQGRARRVECRQWVHGYDAAQAGA